jgi:transcriptional regulator with XRE-family HTH domain
MPRATVNPIDRHVGNRVRQLRIQHNISQGTLAKQLGVTFQQVQKYEKGTNRISAGRLVHIAQFLGVTPPYFFDGAPQVTGKKEEAGQSPHQAAIAKFVASDDCLALAKAFRRIDDVTIRRAVVRMVEALAEP